MDAKIKIGSIVETKIVEGRFAKVVAIRDDEYDVEYGKMDFINNFKAFRPDLVATINVLADQIVRVL